MDENPEFYTLYTFHLVDGGKPFPVYGGDLTESETEYVITGEGAVVKAQKRNVSVLVQREIPWPTEEEMAAAQAQMELEKLLSPSTPQQAQWGGGQYL